MKKQSSLPSVLGARSVYGLLLAIATLALTSCGQRLYYFPQYTFANRPIPPSRLASRVMVSVSTNGTTGALAILDGNRDIRSNVQNTIRSFSIAGFGSGMPTQILNFPEELRGYVYSDADGSLTNVNYGTESSSGSAGSLPRSTSVAISSDFTRIFAASPQTGLFVLVDSSSGASRTFAFNLPNVYRVAINQGGTVALAMVRNSDTLYRLVKLNNTGTPVPPPGAVDCQPYDVPVYCIVPVPGTYNRPIGAYFSLDGTSVFVLNCGTECGGPRPPSLPGSTAGITILQQGSLTINTIPTSTPYPSPVLGTVAVPGGVTTALSDGNTLYLAGQQLQPDGLFAGYLSTMSLATNTVTGQYRVSDGNHSRLLFADDNTLWVGSQFCATGEHAKLGENYNCLTRFDLGTKTAQIVPAVTPGSTTAVVPFPNEDGNRYYYGDLTGICWVQNQHKVYTAYGGQVHAFNTSNGSEIDNTLITVQGTALDVAYMDALTNAAD